MTRNNLHPEFWSWLAGFIDGEGSIGLYKEFDKRKGEKYFYYRPAIQITNTDFNSLEFIKCMLSCGNPIVNVSLKSDKHQFTYQYKIRKVEDIEYVLSCIVSRLKIKHIQAVKIIQYLQNRKSSFKKGWYHPITEQDHKIYDELKILNYRGKLARLTKQKGVEANGRK
jgi:hypothetical protein